MRSRSHTPSAARAFTLVEIMMVMLIVAMVATALTIPLAAHLQVRRFEETRRQLEMAAEAVLGFATVHGRLPCPATAQSRGEERFAPGSGPMDGRCANFHGGFLPAATLGLAPLDSEGFARDPWGTAANRIRYAVSDAAEVGGGDYALTRASGMRAATLPALGAASHYLFVCSEGGAATAAGCPAAQQLTRRAAFVLVSTGLNANEAPAAGSDEARNLDGDPVFVSREPSNVEGRAFDDVLHWVNIHLLASRMVTAGRLP